MSNDANFYHTVHLKDYQTLEEATNIVKSMVPADFAKYVTVDLVRPVYHDPKKREYKLSTLVNFFTNRAKAQKDIESLESWTGVIVGGRDIKKYDQPVEQVKGQNHLIVMDNGEIRSFSGWGHSIGPSGSETTAPTLQRSTVKVAQREFKYSDGRKGLSYDGKMVIDAVNIPESELKTYLADKAMDLDMLDSSMKYQQVLLRGKIGLVMPLENWVDSDELVPITDKHGNVQYEIDETGNLRLDPQNKQPIPRMKYKRVPDGIGQPPIQLQADNSTNEQYVMKISLYLDDDKSGNRVSVQLQRTRLGEHKILLPDVDLVMRDAAASPPGGKEDGWTMLTNMWRGVDVVVAGTIISVNEREDQEKGKSVWYGIDATLVMNVDGVAAPASTVPIIEAVTYPPEASIASDVVTVQPTIPPAQPVIPPTPPVVPPTPPSTSVPEAQPVIVPTLASAPVVTPPVVPPTVVPPVVVPPTPPVPAPVRPAPTVSGGFEQLEKGINTTFDSMGVDTSFDAMMASSFKAVIPTPFHAPHQRPVVEGFMDKVRNDRRAATTAVASPTVPVPTATPTPTDSVKEALASQPNVAPTDVASNIAAVEVVQPTSGVKCGKCGKMLSDDEIMSHAC